MDFLQTIAEQREVTKTDPTPERKIRYRRDIDGMRAAAVLSVLGYHFAPAKFPGGFVGVDIFFVISGFLISSIIYQELRFQTFSIVEFYTRRIRRIYPALLIVLCFVCAGGWMLLMPSGFVALGQQVLGGSAFVANFVMWLQSGYFSPDAALKPLLHLWSLGVEEQYYLIFPLICMAMYRAGSRHPMAIAFITIASLSMLVNVLLVSRFGAATYFLPFSRFWELLAGAGLALWMHGSEQSDEPDKRTAFWRHAASIAGMALLLTSEFAINQFDAFPGWWALLPVTAAVALIAAGETAWVNRTIFSSKPAVLIGLISYPLYLWHWPLLSFTRIASDTWGIPIYRSEKIGLIFLAFILAALTYRYIELPIRLVKDKGRRRRGALYLAGAIVLTGLFGVLVIAANGFPARFPKNIVALDHDASDSLSKAWRDGVCFLRQDQSPSSFAGSCIDSNDSPSKEPLVVLWGDSHAADLFPGFRALQGTSNVRLAQFTASMCPPIMELPIRERPRCLSINQAILDRIRNLKPDVVVLSADWDQTAPDQSRHDRMEKLSRTIELVKAAGDPRVIVIGSVPLWKRPVAGLLAGEIRRNPNEAVPLRLGRSLLEAHDDSALVAASVGAGAVYVSIFDQLCDQTSCLVTTGPTWNDLITYDQSHFTISGSTLVTRTFWQSVIDHRD
ncbi:peptidoglycan/LPS O-acetylase OafA/YrhL [Silvibacterium bohemicum]|uniref:Peptidoglycan/LPS O-acetylase OafA/YrhL n=1 Tax=Silvibacterium bohemicum TaxID=1577686 RepID=A0A841K4Y6_9BACT|nr:acyltransferase family protein [Silvibacterium bohemicum]MBB6145668.1 peptidoglycan/LPS O-acetylase OafA/YrhL [Silvibacterium bohemicum]